MKKHRIELDINGITLAFMLDLRKVNKFLAMAGKAGRCESSWALLKQSVTTTSRADMEKIMLTDKGNLRGFLAIRIATELLAEFKNVVKKPVPPTYTRMF